MWTKGGRGRCIGRFCCCTLLIAVFLIISIILSLALWIRPPSVNIGDVQAPSNGSTLQELDNGLQLNLNVIIGVENPNYFAVDFKSIKAEIFFPINNTLIGSGQANNVNFPSHSNTNFTFPFDIKYTTDIDPSQQIISTIATKCLSNPQQQLTVSYKITLGLRILFITIHPTISNNLSFDCPISADEIQSVLKNMGISGLSSILGGSS